MTVQSSSAPVCTHDFFSEATIAAPLPCYHAMLELGPVVWMERNGLHAISHFAELTAALRNTRVFSSARGVSLNEDVNARLIGSTLNSDPPIHDETRAITAAPLTPRALEVVGHRIASAAEQLAERMVARGAFDAAAELAPYLPLNIVRDLVGLSEDGRERMLQMGLLATGTTPEEFAEVIRRDTPRWGEVIRKAGIKPE